MLWDVACFMKHCEGSASWPMHSIESSPARWHGTVAMHFLKRKFLQHGAAGYLVSKGSGTRLAVCHIIHIISP